MILKRLSVKNFRGIVTQTLEFAPGLNVIAGPNESGKSTLREALHHAFLSPSSSRGPSKLGHIRPWEGKANPEVEVEFHHDGQDYLVRRVFFGKGSEVRQNGAVVAKEDAVLSFLKERVANLSVLWSSQGDKDLAQVPTELQPHLAASEAVSPGSSRFELRLQSLWDEYWTREYERPKEPLVQARKSHSEAQSKVQELRSELESLNLKSQAVERFDGELTDLQSKVTTLEARGPALRAALADWERYRTAQAETEKLQEKHKNESEWIERWMGCATELERLQRAAVEYQDKLAALGTEVGPEPEPIELHALQASRDYVQVLQLHRELEELNAPGSDDLKALEQLLRRVERAGQARERLEKASALQTELERQRAQFALQKADEASLFERAKAQAAARRKLADLESAKDRWVGLRTQILHLWERLDKHNQTLQGLELGSLPTREGLKELESRQEGLKARRQELYREELDGLRPFVPELLESLSELARGEALRPQMEEEQANLIEMQRQLRETEAELPELERAVSAGASAQAVAEDRTRQADRLAELQRKLDGQRGSVEQTLSELANYDEEARRLSIGSEPDRAGVEDLQARQKEATIRLQRFRHQELEDLRVPEPAQLARLEELEHLTAVRRGGPGPLIAIGAGLLILGFVLGLVGGLQAGPSLGVGVGIGVAGALIGLGMGLGARTSPGLKAEREKLLASLSVQSLQQAREKQTRAASLRAQLRPELMREQAASEHYTSLDGAALEAELESLRTRIEAAEESWKQAHAAYSSRRAEHESLLQRNPEAKLKAQVSSLRALTELEVPDRPGPEWWTSTLSKLGSQIEELRSGSGQLERLTEATRLRDEAKSRRERLHNTLETRTEQFEGQFARVPEVGQLAKLIGELGVESVEQAQQRMKRAVELKALLTDEPGDPTPYQDLDLVVVTDELARLRDLLPKANEDFAQAQRDYESKRSTHELLLKQNPEAELPARLDHLRLLARERPELELDVPDQPGEAWVEALRDDRPGQALSAAMSAAREAQSGDNLEEQLEAYRKEVEAIADSLRTNQGALENQLQEVAVLIDGPLPTDLAEAMSQAEESERRLLAENEGLMARLRVESLEQAASRHARAEVLRAQLATEARPQEEVASLRSRTPDPERLEAMTALQLQQELLSFRERLEKAESDLAEARRNWLTRLEKKEEHARENPVTLLTDRISQLRDLAADRLVVPAELTPQWAFEAVKPFREEWASQGEALTTRGNINPPELPEAEAAEQLRLVEGELKKAQDLRERLASELGHDQGELSTRAEIYYELARAEEQCAAALDELNRVEAQAHGRKLLRAKLEEARTELEQDLVGPLRKLIGHRLRQITDGRYHELRLEQDFKAELLLTADKKERKVSDLSFGTKEQLVFLSRLCLAEILSEKERHVLVFDDNLVHTDTSRLATACEMLRQVSAQAQVVLMTCHPERYDPILDVATVHRLRPLGYR